VVDNDGALTSHPQRRIQALKEKRAAKEEKERYEQLAAKMHKKRLERLKRKEKRNKLLNS
jgi:rRNA-processing protein CGR1